jgi:MerR family transcriptional regulator, light-induced transcriptional regulator
MSESKGNTNIYRIGAVANITGLSTHTIRAWERRYGMVLSDRSEGGTRLYPASSLERLILIKQLLDQGESISVLAHLEKETLSERLKQFGDRSEATSTLSQRNVAKNRLIRVAMLGSGPLTRQSYRPSAGNPFEIRFTADSPESLGQFLTEEKCNCDAVVLFVDVIPSRQPNWITQLCEQHRELSWLIVFDLGSGRELATLLDLGVKCLRGPLPEAVIVDLLPSLLSSGAENNHARQLGNTAFEPIFSPEQLNRLANLPSSIQCECPSHMSTLIHQLNSFERYCNACEHTSPQDAALHAELGHETARARSIMEKMLVKVCVQDNIRID